MNTKVFHLLRVFSLAASTTCAALLAGCGGGGLGEVGGKVTYKNKPLAMGQVMIVASDSKPYYGEIQEDGTFKIVGVPEGAAKVVVTSPDPTGAPPKGRPTRKERHEKEVEKPLGDPKKWFAIPAKYADIDKSELKATIQRGTNPPLHLELK